MLLYRNFKKGKKFRNAIAPDMLHRRVIYLLSTVYQAASILHSKNLPYLLVKISELNEAFGIFLGKRISSKKYIQTNMMK